MEEKNIKSLIEKFLERCIDLHVSEIRCNYFMDELELEFKYENRQSVIIFTSCCDIHFRHDLGLDDKRSNYKLLNGNKTPYILYNIDFKQSSIKNIELLYFNIDLQGCILEIYCKDIVVEFKEIESTN